MSADRSRPPLCSASMPGPCRSRRPRPGTPTRLWVGNKPSDVIDREARNDVIFPETPGALPGEVETHQGRGGAKRDFPFAAAPERRPSGRTSFPRVVQQDAATELTMAKALTRDRTFGDQAIGSALSGSVDALGPGDRRPSAINARTMIEPSRGSERPVSPWSGAPASSFRHGVDGGSDTRARASPIGRATDRRRAGKSPRARPTRIPRPASRLSRSVLSSTAVVSEELTND